MRVLILLLALLVAVPVEATVLYFNGFEAGTTIENISGNACASCGPQTTIVRSGKYAWFNVNVGSTTHTGGLSSTTAAVRVYRYFTAYSTASPKPVIQFAAAGLSPVIDVNLQLVSPGTLQIGGTAGFSATNGTTVVTLNRWHRIDVIIDSAAGGIGQVWLDNTLEINTTHTGATGPITTFATSNVLGGTMAYTDDILIQDGTSRPPDGRVIARQGVSTTPTDNAWTKTSGSTINTVWNQTPFTTAINANTGSITGALAQTMFTQSVSVENGTYGPGSIGSADTINACKTGIIGNASSPTQAQGSIRRRLSGVATDTTYRDFSSTTRWQEGALFTDTITNLNLLEYGALKAVTGLAATHSIFAAYLMCDYTDTAKLQIKVASGKLFSIPAGTGALQRR